MRTNVYIDGFNLYHACFKFSDDYRDCKWLDLRALAARLVPQDAVHRVHYFTARVSGTTGNPQKASRQAVYLRALRSLDSLYIQEGLYQKRERIGEIVDPPPGIPTNPWRVRTWEEKGSDLNLATQLLVDAHRGDFEQAVVLSNDSDLRSAVSAVRLVFKLPIIVVSPRERVARDLATAATSSTVLDKMFLRDCQLPETVVLHNGKRITRPTAW